MGTCTFEGNMIWNLKFQLLFQSHLCYFGFRRQELSVGLKKRDIENEKKNVSTKIRTTD